MKTFSYIFKRILIGTGIALLVGFLRGRLLLNTYAKDIGSIYNPFTTSNTSVVSNLDTESVFSIRSGYFSNWGFSTVRFNFSVIKISGDAVAPLVVPSGVALGNYVCDVSSTSVGNSTFTGSTYSAVCPVNLGSTGLGDVVVFLTPNQQNTSSSYRISVGMLFTAETDTDINLDTSGTTNAINNQIANDNTNTQNIINNQNDNTQDIIDNQNDNTQSLQDTIDDNFNKCRDSYNLFSINNISTTQNGLSISYSNNTFIFNGTTTGAVTYTFNSSYPLTIEGTYTFSSHYLNGTKSSGASNINVRLLSTNSVIQGTQLNLVEYDNSRTFTVNNSTIKYGFYIPSGVTFDNYSFQVQLQKGSVATSYEPYGEEICLNRLDEQTNAINDNTQATKDINNTLNNDDITGANSEASSFFSDFQADSHGLSGIITAPLRLIQSLSSSTCSSLVIPLPFVSQNATLPCMSSVYSQFSTFYSLWQLITTGLIAYYILIKLFGHVKGMQDPRDDRIEVLQL